VEANTLHLLLDTIVTQCANGGTPVDSSLVMVVQEFDEWLMQDGLAGMPEQMFAMNGITEQYRRYLLPQDKDSRHSFAMGMLYSLSVIIQHETARSKEKEILEHDVNQVYSKKELFFFLEEHSGLGHTAWAKSVGMSASALTQYLGRNKCERYLSWQSEGRDKYYYLSKRGEELCRLMKLKMADENNQQEQLLVQQHQLQRALSEESEIIRHIQRNFVVEIINSRNQKLVNATAAATAITNNANGIFDWRMKEQYSNKNDVAKFFSQDGSKAMGLGIVHVKTDTEKLPNVNSNRKNRKQRIG